MESHRFVGGCFFVWRLSIFFKGLFAYVFVDLLYCIMIIDCISYFVWDVYSWVGGTDWPHKNWAPTSISDYVIRISSIYNVIDNNVSIQKFTWWFWWFFLRSLCLTEHPKRATSWPFPSSRWLTQALTCVLWSDRSHDTLPSPH